MAHSVGCRKLAMLGQPDITASFSRLKQLTSVLNAAMIKKDAFCTISEDGILFVVQQRNTMQANLFLKRDWFSTFELEGPSLEFSIDIGTVYECLGFLADQQGASKEAGRSDNTQLPTSSISYCQSTGEFTLILAHTDFVTNCRIMVIDEEVSVSLSEVFLEYPVVAKVIMDVS